MNQRLLLAAALFVALAAVIGGSTWFARSHVRPAQPLTISGHITHISNECQQDGTCSLTLDNSKTIITGCGLMANGRTCRPYNQSGLRVGQRVEATVMRDGSNYNLECDTCTIRVLRQ